MHLHFLFPTNTKNLYKKELLPYTYFLKYRFLFLLRAKFTRSMGSLEAPEIIIQNPKTKHFTLLESLILHKETSHT